MKRKDTTFRSQAIGLQFYLTCLRFYLTCLEIYPTCLEFYPTCLEIYLTCLEFYPACSFFYPINQRSHAKSIPKSEGHPAQTECPSSSTNTVFNVIITIYEYPETFNSSKWLPEHFSRSHLHHTVFCFKYILIFGVFHVMNS